jgi:hypothetical protein
MKKILGLIAVLFLVGASYAQSNNVYIGGSYTHNGDLPKTVAGAIGVLESNTNIGGVDAGLSAKLFGPVGLTMDLNLSHNGTQNEFLFLAGPELSARFKQSRLFVNAKFGGVHEIQDVKLVSIKSLASSGFAYSFGVGGEKYFGKVIGLRTTVDYIYSDQFGASDNNLRVAGGLVFRFGK